MAFTVPPPIDPSISARLRSMRVNSDIFFVAGMATSVKAIASRIGAELKRTYRTAKEEGGVRVWRMK
jgi:hypothetical protein